MSKIKSRWCLIGHHDPDLFTKVLAGKCHSPTLSQFGQSLILQMIASNRWKMHLGYIKGAFLEANVRQKALDNPVFAELPPGGVRGVEPGSLIQVLGNFYGANDAPHEWYCEFNRVALEAGFVRSKFDNCSYLCYNQQNQLYRRSPWSTCGRYHHGRSRQHVCQSSRTPSASGGLEPESFWGRSTARTSKP